MLGQSDWLTMHMCVFLRDAYRTHNDESFYKPWDKGVDEEATDNNMMTRIDKLRETLHVDIYKLQETKRLRGFYL
jgi:hypothetical protein